METYREQLQAMSEGYCRTWNEWEQSRIDADIERNRKTDVEIALGLPCGSEVRVEQISHEFIFGAHIFNFNQLGSDERNETYRNLFGTVFNSATIAFYWQPFEPTPGKMRFETAPEDTAEFWNHCESPASQPHWRRPPTDEIVAFCEKKGIRRHGHTLVWGSRQWQYPRWIMDLIPKEYLVQLMTDERSGGNFMIKSPAEIDRLLPGFSDAYRDAIARRIQTIAARYGNRIQSWDVCNESALDFSYDRIIPGEKICKSTYGLMPGDYPHLAFDLAGAAFPPEVKLNINDYLLSRAYVAETDDLRKRGSKIDILGAQMHCFDPGEMLNIADGKSGKWSPTEMRQTFACLEQAKLPIHISEITIPAPHNDERGQAIQAVVSRNLYRLWFSLAPTMGITWWNVVDGCGALNEPSVSGLFSRAMAPKPAFFALEDLINRQWKTRLELTADRNGRIGFRGFRGTYEISWKNADGTVQKRLHRAE